MRRWGKEILKGEGKKGRKKKKKTLRFALG